MIYRKWSLLTGPVAILVGIVAALPVANYIVLGDPFRKPEPKEEYSSSSTK